MNYLQDNGRKKKRNRIIPLLIVVTVLFFYQGKIYSAFFGDLDARAEPLLKGGVVLKNNISAGVFSIFAFKNSLISENESLKNELEESKIKLTNYNHLLTENMELKALLGRPEKEKTVLASILAKPNQSPYDTLLLDVGTNQGIGIDNSVLAYGTTIIGKVREVTPTTSKIVLFSSSSEEYDGTVAGRNIPLKLYGRGGGNLAAELPRGILINKGDQVLSNGLHQHILGVVDSIYTDPRNPFQSILFKSPVNVMELHFVEVVISP